MGENLGPTTRKVVENLAAEEKRELEEKYCVFISPRALLVACNTAYMFFGVEDDRLTAPEHQQLLQKKAAHILDRACFALRHEIVTDEEETALDKDEYLLLRVMVEVAELSKEHDFGHHHYWLRYAEHELRNLMVKLDPFISRLNSSFQSHNRASYRSEELLVPLDNFQGILQQLFSTFDKSFSPNDMSALSLVIHQLNKLAARLAMGIPKAFRLASTVGPHLVAKVASSLTGVPSSWLLHHSRPPLQKLASEMERVHFEQKRAIFQLRNAFKKPVSSCRPLGTFIFAGWERRDLVNFVEVLAEKLYDNKDAVIHLNSLRFQPEELIELLVGVPARDGKPGSSSWFTERVKQRPYSVIIFQNADVAHPLVISFLEEVSRFGRIIDAGGQVVDFTHSLIIVTTDLNTPLDERCECISRFLPLSGVGGIKQLLESDLGVVQHKCGVRSFLEKVKNRFGEELFDLVDDVIQYDYMFHDHGILRLVRIQLRELARDLVPGGFILHASQPVLVCKSLMLVKDKDELTDWVDENVRPVLVKLLSEKKINGRTVVYLDRLVRSDSLSYRLADSESVFENHLPERYKGFKKLRSMYRMEKQKASKICLLRYKLQVMQGFMAGLKLSGFLVSGGSEREVSGMGRVVREVVAILGELKVMFKTVSDAADTQVHPVVRDLFNSCMINSAKESRLNAFILDAFSKIICSAKERVPPPISFLLLGLTGCGKDTFLRSVAEDFKAYGEQQLLVYMNLSKFAGEDGLSLLIDELRLHIRSYGCPQKVVRMRPFSIFFFDKVERAHISVFSALLSMLDFGTCRDSEGNIMDFSDTVILLGSDLGNLRVISNLVEGKMHGDEPEKTSEQAGGDFRLELLNRVDEIVLFKGCTSQEMNISRLPLKDGVDFGDPSGFLFPYLRFLFRADNDPNYRDTPHDECLSGSLLTYVNDVPYWARHFTLLIRSNSTSTALLGCT